MPRAERWETRQAIFRLAMHPAVPVSQQKQLKKAYEFVPLWVVIGTIFFAGVHDFGAIWASVRNRARSIGALTGDVVSQRSRVLFMIVIFLLLLMVNAVFGVIMANEMIAMPSSVAHTNSSGSIQTGGKTSSSSSKAWPAPSR